MGINKDNQSAPSESQAGKFRAAARRIGCDEDEARWTERLKKVAKACPKDAEPT